MKINVLLFCILFLSGCSSLKEGSNKEIEYEIVTTELKIDNETFYESEILFYKPKSAMDAIRVMIENHGDWNSKAGGKHDERFTQFLWSDAKLFSDDRRYMIFADGIETPEQYFTSLMIFDQNANNCLLDSHPDKEYVIEYFSEKLKNLSNDISTYQHIKRNRY